MKKLITLLVLLTVGSAFATAPASQTVGTNSVMVVPRKPLSYTDWTASTAYAQGACVKSGFYYYFAVVAGTTSTTAPTHTSGEATDGTVTWRQVSQNRRQGVVVSIKTASGKADLSLANTPAIADGGIRLSGEAHSLVFSVDDNFQGEIHAISATTNDVVIGIQEY